MPLKATGLEFGFGKANNIFAGFSLTIQPGEVVGLVGKSGSGKTTLARILAGHLLPRHGKVTVGGRDLLRKEYRPVQLVFQHPERAIDPRWRMRKVLAESWRYYSETIHEQTREQAENEFGIDRSWWNRFSHELSAGELQRFCVARALTPQTRYLIADEMTAMLDAITQAQIWQTVLQRTRKNGLGVLVISHEWPLIEKLCSRVVEMKNNIE